MEVTIVWNLISEVTAHCIALFYHILHIKSDSWGPAHIQGEFCIHEYKIHEYQGIGSLAATLKDASHTAWL